MSRILSFMRKLPRKRRILKWAGLLTCALLMLTIVLTRWWSISWSKGNHWGFFQWGAVAFGYHNQVDDFRYFRWYVRRNIQTGPLFWWFDYQPGTQRRGSCFITPLWLPLAMIGVPTILAWRRDRPFPPGHCQKCGYDLTGNLSGVCPECGIAANPKRVRTA